MGSGSSLVPLSSTESNDLGENGSVRCARCTVFNIICREGCVFAHVFGDIEKDVENFLLLHDIYGVDQVENILNIVQPSDRKMAASTLIFEARQRKIDPVFGVTRITEELTREVQRLRVDLETLQRIQFPDDNGRHHQ